MELFYQLDKWRGGGYFIYAVGSYFAFICFGFHCIYHVAKKGFHCTLYAQITRMFLESARLDLMQTCIAKGGGKEGDLKNLGQINE